MFNLKGTILLTVGNISAVKDELNFKTYVSQALKRYLKAGVHVFEEKNTRTLLRVNF
jgi:hypothetical protein